MAAIAFAGALTLGLQPTSGASEKAVHAGSASATGTGTATGTSCPAELPHVGLASSRPDYALDNSFRSYANSSRGWTGGDGGTSVPIPGGRDAWLFDDSYLGKVANGARTGAPFLHNAIVIQHPRSYSTLHRIRHHTELEFMNYRIAPLSGRFYWNNDGIVSGGSLWVSYSSYYYPGEPSVFGFERTGTVFARYDLAGLKLETVAPPPADDLDITWGVWMMNHGPYVYIYGNAGAPNGYTDANTIYLARVPEGNLLAPWQYYSGTGWTSQAAAVTGISTVASSQFSIAHVGNVYVLVTMADSFESNHIMGYFSCRPTGPFVDGTVLYTTTGQTGVYGTEGIPGVYTYGATLHPELTTGDQLVISYDVNTSDWALLDENVNIVRPRYVRATLTFHAPAA